MADVGDLVSLLPPLDRERPATYRVLAIGDDGSVSVAVPFDLPPEFVTVVEKAGDAARPPPVVDLGTAQVLPPFDKQYPDVYRVLSIAADGSAVLAVDGHDDGVGFGAEFVKVAPSVAVAVEVPL